MKRIVGLTVLWLVLSTLSVSVQAQSWKELLDRADSLSKAADYDSAIVIGTHALGKAEVEHGKEDTTTATTLLRLGVYNMEKGNYDQAELLTKRALVIRRKVLGPDHPEVARSLLNLGSISWYQANYAEAESLYKSASILLEKALGSEHPDVAKSLDNLAVVYLSEGRYAEAEPLYKRSLAISEKILGSENKEVARIQNNLASLYYSQGKYTEAESLFKSSLEIREKTLGPGHPDVADCLHNLALIRYNQTRYEEAEDLYKQTLVIREKALGPEHPDVAKSLYSLAIIYGEHSNRFAEAESLSRRALAIREKALGPEHPDVALTLNWLGLLYYFEQRYAEAEPLFKRSIAIREKALGSEDSEAARALNNLASLYFMQGKYTVAEPLYKKSLTIREKVLGSEHPDVAKCLYNLAIIYAEHSNRFAEAESLSRRALAIREKALGPEHPDVAHSLDQLAKIFFIQGKYSHAETFTKKSLALRERLLGSEHPDVAISLDGLMFVYGGLGKYTEAERLCKRALAIRENALGPDHAEVGFTLQCLANIYSEQDKPSVTEALYKRALTISEKTLGSEHPDVGYSLINLAWLYRELGRYDEAEPLLKRALAIFEKSYGSESLEVAYTQIELATLYTEQSRYTEAEPLHLRAWMTTESLFGPESHHLASSLERFSQYHYLTNDIKTGLQMARRAFEIRLKNFSENSSILSEKDALSYSQFARHSANNYISLFLDSELNKDTLDGTAIDVIFASKGQVSDEIFARYKSLISETDSATQAIAESYGYAKLRLAKLYVEGPGDDDPKRYRAMLDSLSREKEKLEEKLAGISASFRREQDLREINAERIVESLPEESILVEYLRYNRLPQKGEGVPHYLAALLTDRGNVQVTDLGPADAIDSTVAKYRDHSFRVAAEGASPKRSDVDNYREIAKELYEQVWKPIADRLDNADLLFVAPDGALNIVSFAGLMDETGKYLIEKCPIQYLSAGRDLLRLKYEDSPGSGLLAMGDPNFDATAQVRMETTSPQLVEAEKLEISLYAIRNVRSGCDLLYELEVNPLPTTREEVRVISQSWRKFSKESVQSYVGAGASEENFKREAPGKRTIHLATHGYYLTDECLPKTRKSSFGSTDIVVGENPLLLSGLLLAGANLHGEGADSLGAEDGILTAEEISAMDLRGTEMVVLSACETGLGEVKSGEGVYGLRRAFQMAGARTVVVSLWPVSDRTTAEIMSQLYSKRSENLPTLLQKIAKNQIAKLKKTGQPTHPYNWGAFIAIGDWK